MISSKESSLKIKIVDTNLANLESVTHDLIFDIKSFKKKVKERFVKIRSVDISHIHILR